jgi:succinoglycan biosynthesis transport protein ExoP
MNLQYYLALILTKKKILLLLSFMTAITALLGGIYLAKYKTTAEVLVKPQETQSGAQMQAGLVARSSLGLLVEVGSTYPRVLQSRPIAEKVVERLQLDQKLTAQTTSQAGFFAPVKKVVKKVLQTLVFGAPPAVQYTPFEMATQTVQNSIYALLLANTTIIQIGINYDNPILARDIVNTVAEVFVEFSREINAHEAITTRKFLEEQVKDAQEKVEASQETLRVFNQEIGVLVDLPGEIQKRFGELATLETDLKQVITSSEFSKSRIQKLRQELPGQSKYVQASSTMDNNPLIQNLKQNLIQLETQLPRLLVDFTPKHPQVIALKEQIAQVKNTLNQEVKRLLTAQTSKLNTIHQTIVADLLNEEATLQALQARHDALESVITDFKKELQTFSDKQSEWQRLVDNVHFNTTRLENLKQQLESVKLTEAQKVGEIGILERAQIPRYPTVNGLPLIAFPCIGLLFGLMVGLCLVILQDYFDDSVKSVEMIEKDFKLPVYATIVDIADGQQNRNFLSKGELLPIQQRLFTHVDPISPISEEFRYLGMNIQSLQGVQNKRLQCLLISSALPKEGKTMTVCNLAVALAQLKRRVLIVDCDLRNPMIHKMFQVSQEEGLTDFLSNSSTNPVKLKSSGIDRLMVITSGTLTPNSIQLLTSKRLRMLLKALKTKYDFIFLDSSPVATVADGLMLASLPEVEGILLTVKAESTRVSTFLHVKSLIENVNGKILGTVLTGVKFNERSKYYSKH